MSVVVHASVSKWLELELTKKGDLLCITALGSGHRRPAPVEIPPAEGLEAVLQLTKQVQSAAKHGQPLTQAGLEAAQTLYEAIFRGEIRDVLVGLSPSPNEPLVIRIFAKDRDLAGAPWEALCKKDTNQGFIGTESQLLVARGEYSKEAWQPREVNGAVRVLAIAPGEGEQLLGSLRQTLNESIEAGEIEWLEPIAGPNVSKDGLYNRLRRSESPHIVHFVGHGSFEGEVPTLRLADDEDGEVWLPVEALARELGARFAGDLRLVTLEACEGARAGAFGSAAVEMLKAGADAVVAHLWPVSADVARRCSKQLYRSLTGVADNMGDVGKSLAAARRTLLTDGAQAFSPVLYLRGPGTKIFDFAFRKVKRRSATIGGTNIAPSLQVLLSKRFTMVLGDLEGDRAELRKEIVTDMERRGDAPRERETLDSLMQRFVLRFGQGALHDLFQNALAAPVEATPPPLVRALAKHLRPGVHMTLLWQPHLERAIAAEHPTRTIYAIQPPLLEIRDSRVYVLCRPAGETDWREEAMPKAWSIDQDFIILRMYGGNTAEPNPAFTLPILTDDDHVQGLLGSQGLEPPAWMEELLGRPRVQPGLFVGLSSLDWRHRMLLRFLYDSRPAPSGSVALVLPTVDKTEMDIWERGAGLPGRSRIAPIQEPPDELAAAMEKLLSERAA
jgi:hypothetical protein